MDDYMSVQVDKWRGLLSESAKNRPALHGYMKNTYQLEGDREDEDRQRDGRDDDEVDENNDRHDEDLQNDDSDVNNHRSSIPSRLAKQLTSAADAFGAAVIPFPVAHQVDEYLARDLQACSLDFDRCLDALYSPSAPRGTTAVSSSATANDPGSPVAALQAAIDAVHRCERSIALISALPRETSAIFRKSSQGNTNTSSPPLKN